MKDNQPSVAERLVSEPWGDRRPDCVEKDRGHGRREIRTLRVRPVPSDAPLPGFPSARQMLMMTRERARLDGTPIGEMEVVFAITSLTRKQATPRQIARMIRGHWLIENGLHYVRDVTYGEDLSRIRTGSGPRVMASVRNIAISIHRLHRATNIASVTRACNRDCRRSFMRLVGRMTREPLAA